MINIKNVDPNQINLIKSRTKISIFITLDILLSKTLAIQKLMVQIVCTLLLIKQIDILKK